MKRSFRIKRVYRLFDCLLGQSFGRFYRSKNSALRSLYLHRSNGESVILEKYREFTGYWRQFESFVRSR